MLKNNRIIFKKSSVKGAAPTRDDLVPGEIAINTHNGVVYSVDDRGNIFIFGQKVPLMYNASTIITQTGTVVFDTLNETMTLRGSYGCRTQANAATNTIDIFADQVDAIKLGGQLPAYYAAASHLHDERYAPQEKTHADSLAGKSWYRIATADSHAGTTRAGATFNVSTSGHYVRFNAAGQGVSNSSINILSGYRTKPIQEGQDLSEIRIVTAANNKVALEVYLNTEIAAQLTVSMQNDTINHNGWTLIAPTAAANDLASGFALLANISVSDPYGFDTNAEIREKGQRVFSPNHQPDWSDILNKPPTIAPSEHDHDGRYYTETEIDAKFNAILDGASEQLNSFKELSDALLANGDAIGALNDSIALKANRAGDTFTGDVKFNAGAGVKLNSHLRFNSENTGLGWGIQEPSSNGYLYFETRSDAGNWSRKAYFDTNGQLYISGSNKVWSQGNDGAGSGLDADVLDGQQGSYYRNASNLNAGTVPLARLSGTYDIGITGTAKTAINANNAVNLNNQPASFYLNAANMDAGILPVARLSGTYNIHVTGNAASATKLQTARSIILAGDVSGTVLFDGTGNATMTTTVANDSHTHDGRYYTEAESDLRYSAVAVSGATHSLINKDTRSVVSPPSDYSRGMYNEFKHGHSVGLTGNAYTYALTHAAWQDDSGTGNSQLLFQTGALYLRYGTRASGWNDPVRIYTQDFKPVVGDVAGALANSGNVTHSGRITFTGDGFESGLHFLKTGSNDGFGIRCNNPTGNDGEIEFYTTDDDNEPFVFRHYTTGTDGTGSKVEWGKLDQTGFAVKGNLVFHDGNKPTIQQVTGTMDFGLF